jgi:Ni,Fe-hydrogenase III large subunit
MSHPNVLLQPLAERETLDYHGFGQRVTECLTRRDRLLSLFGSPDEGSSEKDAPCLHAVFLDQEHSRLTQFLGRRQGTQKYHSLTPQFPELHCFEREVHEQYGLRIIDHPWLKPIRFECENLKRMNDYRFYELAGKEVHEVAVGPIHAGVIEPGHFRFMCYGETVHHLEIHLGYQHRGAESLLRKSSPRKLTPLVESVAGDTAVGYVLGFCRAWEALCELDVRPEVEAIRGLALELERVAMHLVGLGGLATDIAFLPGSSTYGRLRTSIINLSMRLCGSRFGRSWFRPGELRFPFGATHKEDVRKTVRQVQHDIGIINALFRKSKTVRHRLSTTGTVPTPLAQEIGLVGMAGRASGLTCDLRTELRGGIYGQQPMPLVVEPTGDCWARALIRLREIDASLNWIMQLIDTLPDVEADPPAKYEPRPNCSVLSFEEGWRGEVMHSIETDADGKIAHYKLQDPSLRNWFGLAQSVRNNAIYDFPICNKSFDLSYCGNDL